VSSPSPCQGEGRGEGTPFAIPQGTDPNSPFVVILDPAVGTATFLVEVIDVIHKTMKAKWLKEGRMELEIPKLWNDYVPKHLLPRLFGYELMMAPYAIAHMKIGLKLHETGYRFGSNERARVYLTNSLEPPGDDKGQREFEEWAPALAHEAQAVNGVKRKQRFTIVIGNPPYSASISEPEWLMRLLDDWKQGLNETKSDLNREEWKFFRFAQHHCTTTGAGVVGVIINRDFLDGIVKRRMREHIGQSFPMRLVVDLNGDVKGNIADENVFEIEQGVAIALLCTHHTKPILRFASRVGTRSQKYADLEAKKPIDAALAGIELLPPYFRWVPFLGEHAKAAFAEYSTWPQIKSAFGLASSGIQTKRDDLSVAFTREEIWENVRRFHALPTERARETFDLGEDGRDWTVNAAKADVADSGPSQQFICPILYRPFDIRFTYWTGRTRGFLAYPRRDVMQHIIGRKNVGMIFNRQIVGDSVSHFGAARIPICHGTFYLGNKGQDYFAPLLVFDNDLLEVQKTGRNNFTPAFLVALRNAIGDEVSKLTPEDIFHYTYAVFHSPGYRIRHAEFLKMDFPRLPLTSSLELFRELARLGGELVALHLVESPTQTSISVLFDRDTRAWRYQYADACKPPIVIRFTGPAEPVVEKVSYANDTVWIDKARRVGFAGVPEDVWNFHIGGYQVCAKWLKDRKGRVLSAEDITHYHRIVVALYETIRLMAEIDKTIDAHGGWPAAFTPRDAKTPS
jgi:predicted helicase